MVTPCGIDAVRLIKRRLKAKGFLPVYEEEMGLVYCGDCLALLPLIPPEAVAMLLTDPPYGINHPTDYRTRGRGKLAACRDYPPVVGDGGPYDPRPLLKFYEGAIALWGANYYASRLPDQSGWLVWDKMRPDSLDQSTCELAWTNFVKGVRRFRHQWNGMLRDSEETLSHPTQKPVPLMEWCMQFRWSPHGLVLDPYLGSGATAVAAKRLGRPFVGIEIEAAYCDSTAQRLAQGELF